jgi:hypothetical protein
MRLRLGEKGRLAGCSLGRAKAHPYISERARIRCGRDMEFGVGHPVVWRDKDWGEGMIAGCEGAYGVR